MTVFVTWDPEIIPQSIASAADYPGVKERIEFSKTDGDSRADFFAKYSNASLGRIKNLYLAWARLKGPLSAECQQMNRLFSQCVDGNNVNVPEFLVYPPDPSADNPPFVLDELHAHAKAHINTAIDVNILVDGTIDNLEELLLCRDHLALSEFELLRMVLRRCKSDDHSFDAYSHYINYSALSDEQKAWLLSHLPASKSMPALVMNGLLQSDLVTPSELRKFQLHHHRLHWRPVFQSEYDRMGRFLSSTTRALELFHKKLIILKLDERLTIAIYVPRKVTAADEVLVDDSVRVFAFPRSQGTSSTNYKVTPTKKTYRLYCDDGIFELYEAKRDETFVFLRGGGALDNPKCLASIRLEKIGKEIKKHAGRIHHTPVQAAVCIDYSRWGEFC